jgi:hypothetical protein
VAIYQPFVAPILEHYTATITSTKIENIGDQEVAIG